MSMWDRVLERVKNGLMIWGQAFGYTTGKEMLFARNFLEGLRVDLGEEESVGKEVMIEDALILRIESLRLSRQAGDLRREKNKWDKDNKKTDKNEKGSFKDEQRLVSVNEKWEKKRERLSRVMRELSKQYSCPEAGRPMSLAELVAPILKAGEGVLEEAMEFEEKRLAAQKGID